MESTLVAQTRRSPVRYWSFFEKVDFEKAVTEADKVEASTAKLATDRRDLALIIGSSERDFPLWRKRCLDDLEARRLPAKMFEDLIPSPEKADHALRDAERWTEELEKTFPSRRQWLASEGVTSPDIDDFWGSPPWVQNFREGLVKREFELQLSTTMKSGLTFIEALQTAMLFLPTFAIAPPSSHLYTRFGVLPFPENSELEDSGLIPDPLPWELFSRVNRFLGRSTGHEIERLAMARDTFSMNELCRRLILEEQV